jgi:glycosyltransferase involved in cell wall biosynthesis
MLVSVVMPTFDQEAFVPAAVASLLAQTLTGWELVVVDDGSPGDVRAALGPALEDPRIRLVRSPANEGLGAALNRGLDATSAPYVAYLPSDDLLHEGHLASLAGALDASPGAALAVAGIRHGDHGIAEGRIEGEPLQLVQVMHRRVDGERWLEREELTTDDLDRMLWERLRAHGEQVETGVVTCRWVEHPRQRHLVLREPDGGLNPYKARYPVRRPLRFHSTAGHLHDEVDQYAAERERPPTPRAAGGLRILLVGDLAHNADRILALEERGHELHGLWTEEPHWYNTVGPVPFGHVRDVPHRRWADAVRRLRPDVVYALLNWQSIRLAHRVLDADLGIPFVWHFKEGPFDARRRGLWPQLADLVGRSDGQVYSSAEARDWFAATVPAAAAGRSLVLDGDLPRAARLAGDRAPLLSDEDGEIHTVVPGRPLGPEPAVVARLAERGVHVHLFSGKAQHQWRGWVEEVQRLAPGHVHLHPQVDQERWVETFSRFDAGWLHTFSSSNGGDVRAATWNDLNVPARMGTLAAAGVPMIQRDNAGSLVATQTLARDHELGLFFGDADDLADQLHDRARMAALRESVWRGRGAFTFDAHADRLVGFFREVVAGAGGVSVDDRARTSRTPAGTAADSS